MEEKSLKKRNVGYLRKIDARTSEWTLIGRSKDIGYYEKL